MKRPSHLQVVPDHESSHLRELLRVKDQELKGNLCNLLYLKSYSYPYLGAELQFAVININISVSLVIEF